MGPEECRLHTELSCRTSNQRECIGVMIVHSSRALNCHRSTTSKRLRQDTTPDTPLPTQAHGPIGIVIAALAYSQLVFAFIRPKPDAPIRRWWNLQHWVTGRTLILLAVTNILIGVQVGERCRGQCVWRGECRISGRRFQMV